MQTTLGVAGHEMQASAEQLRLSLAASQMALTEIQNSSRTAFASVERLTDTTREAIQNTQPELVNALKSAREAADAARMAAARVSELGAPGSATREDLDSALRDLALAARSFKQFSETLEDHPNALLLGKRKQETP
jgi:paraquat-inducible protein B